MSERRKKLTELEGRLGGWDDSQGVWFKCPSCNNGHSIYVPFAGASPYKAGLWTLHSAEDLTTLTLTPSVNLDVPRTDPKWTDEQKAQYERTRCRFHGFVTNGEVTW
jgi:hypothetical protein